MTEPFLDSPTSAVLFPSTEMHEKPIDLAPERRCVPFSWCCYPSSNERRQDRLHHYHRLTPIQEETWQNDVSEQSQSLITIDVPDLDARDEQTISPQPGPAAAAANNNAVMELWRMIFAFLLVGWFGTGGRHGHQQTKLLKQHGEASAAAAARR